MSEWRIDFNPTGLRQVAVTVTHSSNTVRNSMSRLQSHMVDQRVLYILDRITEDEYSDFIIKNEDKIQREQALMRIYQTYAGLLQDLYRDWFHLSLSIVRNSIKSFEETLKIYIHLHERANQIHEVITEALELGGQKLGIKRLGRIREHGRITKT